MEKRLTESVKRRIILLIRIGHTPVSAAASAGVSAETFREWMKLADAKPRSTLGSFLARVRQVEAQTQMMALAKVRCSPQWQAQRWLLSRLDPEAFGDGVNSNASGPSFSVVPTVLGENEINSLAEAIRIIGERTAHMTDVQLPEGEEWPASRRREKPD